MISNINLFYLYYNRTTKSGGLPNLSYIKRKPEPLGTEFKVATDGLSGMMAWLEIQEGKERMPKKDFFIELGATAGCVMRGVKNGEKYESESDNNESTKKTFGWEIVGLAPSKHVQVWVEQATIVVL